MTECSRGDGLLMSSRASRTAAMMDAATIPTVKLRDTGLQWN